MAAGAVCGQEMASPRPADRPLEILLYDWWPVRAQARLYDRLAVTQVSVRRVDAAEKAP